MKLIGRAPSDDPGGFAALVSSRIYRSFHLETAQKMERYPKNGSIRPSSLITPILQVAEFLKSRMKIKGANQVDQSELNNFKRPSEDSSVLERKWGRETSRQDVSLIL